MGLVVIFCALVASGTKDSKGSRVWGQSRAVKSLAAVVLHSPLAGLHAPGPISSYDGPLLPFHFEIQSLLYRIPTRYFRGSDPISAVGSSHHYTPSAREYEDLFKSTQVSQPQTSCTPHLEESGRLLTRVEAVQKNTASSDLAKQPRSVCHRKSLSTLESVL